MSTVLRTVSAAACALIVSCVLLISTALANGTPPPTDPLNSPMWEHMVKQYFADASVIFDDRVSVLAAPQAEDSLNFPVMIDASKIDGITEMVVFADLNPIATVLRFFPDAMPAKIGFRIKLQQGTPVRAAVKTEQGWHVGGLYVDAAGGGCTAPSVGSGNADWASRLGEVSSRVFTNSAIDRLRFRVMHPMDTGLADGIPAFYIERIQVNNADGDQVGVIMPFEPIAENPIFTVEVPGAGALAVSGRDNNGNLFDAEILR